MPHELGQFVVLAPIQRRHFGRADTRFRGAQFLRKIHEKNTEPKNGAEKRKKLNELRRIGRARTNQPLLRTGNATFIKRDGRLAGTTGTAVHHANDLQHRIRYAAARFAHATIVSRRRRVRRRRRVVRIHGV